MKRLRTLLIALLVALALVGCETGNPTTRDSEGGNQQPAVGQTTNPENQPTTGVGATPAATATSP